MIERVNQTIKVSTSSPPKPFRFNFPRASLLEYTFRILPHFSSFSTTHSMLLGVELGFGIGNPPDFGTGSINSHTVAMPEQRGPLETWEKKLEAARVHLGVGGPGGSGLLEVLAFAVTAYENASEEERQHTAGVALVEAQSAVKDQEQVIGEIEAEEPSGWTPPVSVSLARSFDALTINLLTIASANTFEFEHTVEISRPEDVGPTYTRPLQGNEGG